MVTCTQSLAIGGSGISGRRLYIYGGTGSTVSQDTAPAFKVQAPHKHVPRDSHRELLVHVHVPVGLPPVAVPPVAVPPVGLPPVAVPPVALPPVALPPVGIPPVGIPPVGIPPVGPIGEIKVRVQVEPCGQVSYATISYQVPADSRIGPVDGSATAPRWGELARVDANGLTVYYPIPRATIPSVGGLYVSATLYGNVANFSVETKLRACTTPGGFRCDGALISPAGDLANQAGFPFRLIDFYDLRFVEQCPNLAMSVVAFSLRLGGDVSSFTPDVRTEMKTAIAARASVPITAVELAVTPGSVIVGVTIQTPTVTAASVQSAIYSSTSSLANANAMFSSVTGVSITVEEVVTQPTTTAQANGAAQGLTAAGGGGSAGPATGGAIGGAIGGIFVVVLALFGYWRYRNQKMQTKKMENRAQVIKQNKTEMTTKKTTKTRTTTTTTTVDSLDS